MYAIRSYYVLPQNINDDFFSNVDNLVIEYFNILNRHELGNLFLLTDNVFGDDDLFPVITSYSIHYTKLYDNIYGGIKWEHMCRILQHFDQKKTSKN